jgi:Protein of unknown function (DUF3592)
MKLPLELGLLFFLGAPFVAYGWYSWSKVRLARTFAMVEATILESKIVEIQIDEGEGFVKGYQPQIRFSAIVNGQNVTSTRLCPDAKAFQFFSYQQARAFVDQYAIQSLVMVCCSNNDPRELLLKSDVDWARKSHYLGVAGLGLCIWIAMFGLTWVMS